MSKIVIPGSSAPANLHLADGIKITMVESDMYNICERIREVDPSLFIVQLIDDARGCAYAIMEHCADDEDRLVYKTRELDARVIEKCRYLKAVPFEKRFAQIEEQIDKEEAEQRELEMEELYEQLGAPMLPDLYKTGFIDSRPTSYPIVSGRLRV